MNHSQFSIDTQLTKSQIDNLDSKASGINDRIEKICEKAVINGFPIARVVLAQMNPTPADLKMLSKVFGRLAEIMTEYKDVQSKSSALKAISENSDWLYSTIGAPGRDIDLFLQSLETPATKELES